MLTTHDTRALTHTRRPSRALFFENSLVAFIFARLSIYIRGRSRARRASASRTRIGAAPHHLTRSTPPILSSRKTLLACHENRLDSQWGSISSGVDAQMVAFVRIGGTSHSRGEQVHDLPLGVAASLRLSMLLLTMIAPRAYESLSRTGAGCWLAGGTSCDVSQRLPRCSRR